MIQLAGYLSVLLHALALVGMAACVGGLLFCALVLNPVVGGNGEFARRRVLRLGLVGAWGMLACQLGGLLLAPWGLAENNTSWPFREYLSTGFAQASCWRLLGGLGFTGLLHWLAAAPSKPGRWHAAIAASLAYVASGAFVVHAVSRLEEAAVLMVTTVVHQLAAVVWVGSVMGLLACAGMRRESPADLWPRLLARFSPLGMTCVAALVGCGVFIASRYLGDWASFIGTNYGIMVIAKLLLLGVALALAFINFRHTRKWRATGDATAIERQLPPVVEAELAALVAIMLLGASLAATPPAADLATERASLAEVIDTLAPKIPRLVPPDRAELRATGQSALDFFNPAGEIDKAQSNFNHNISGLLLLLIAGAAIADRLRLTPLARHWPLLFLPFALVLQVIVEPTGWPLGNEPFLSTLRNPSVLQHRLASVLPLAIGFMEWRVQLGKLPGSRLRFTFPLLCFLGGAVLLTHTHVATGLKQEFLIEVSHAGIALCAVLAGIGRWLELRLPPPAPRITGFIWTGSLLAIGFLLLFYREV